MLNSITDQQQPVQPTGTTGPQNPTPSAPSANTTSSISSMKPEELRNAHEGFKTASDKNRDEAKKAAFQDIFKAHPGVKAVLKDAYVKAGTDGKSGED